MTNHALRKLFLSALAPAVILLASFSPSGPIREKPSAAEQLRQVKLWAYQLQYLDDDGAVDALVESHYDMFVLEPTRSDRDTADFDTKGMVQRLHNSSGKNLERRLVIAYIDIGEAEDWRWYWKKDWVAPKGKKRGDPDFLIAEDPDGWSGNYPVAYWDKRWRNIMIYDKNSALNQVIDDGFDGIYMDWVEACYDETVEEAAEDDGVDPAKEMVRFIKRIRKHARKRDPDFLLIQQNACELWEDRRRIFRLVDGFAQEHVYFRGEADTDWEDEESGDIRVPKRGEGYSTEFYEWHLKRWLRKMPVFNCEYARKPRNVQSAYSRALKKGYVPYVSLTPLSRLTETPPPGY
jgi:cysteinyl-tRNA synthetase